MFRPKWFPEKKIKVKKKIITLLSLFCFVVFLGAGCGSKATYSGQGYAYADYYSYSKDKPLENITPILFEYKSKDDITFVYQYRKSSDEEWKETRFSAALKSEIEEEKDILDTSTNKRYSIKRYHINAKLDGLKESFPLLVVEYYYSSSADSYVFIRSDDGYKYQNKAEVFVIHK